MTIFDPVQVLALPDRARVDRRVPKALLLQHGASTTADKRRITDGVEALRWLAVLKPATVGIPPCRDADREYLEIALVALTLRPGAATARVLELTHRAIPYPVVAVAWADGSPLLSLAHKRWAHNDRTRVVLDDEVVAVPLPVGRSDPQAHAFLAALPLPHHPPASLFTVYSGWIDATIAFLASRVTGAFALPTSRARAAARRVALRDHARLESTIAGLRSQAGRAQQLSRRVQINIEVQRLRAARDATRARPVTMERPMRKLTADDPETRSPNIVAKNLERLQKLFPEAVTEGTVDYHTLKQLLGGDVDERDQKYCLNWHGKRSARQLALTPSTGTLRPCPADSVDWASTKNLMIEGDNLEVLKLLQKSYAGRVKLIYIDPPYNKGKDFVYPDTFHDNLTNYLELTGQTEDGAKVTSNTEAGGRFHTSWLNMMYPRLKLARNLLHPSGTVFISCDDNELPRLRLVMDELFGEENFVANLIWQRSKRGDSKLIATVHEYMLCYSRDKSAVLGNRVWRRPKPGVEAVLSKYAALRQVFGNDHVAIRHAMMTWYRELGKNDPRRAHKHYSWSDDRGLYFADNFAGPDDGRESRPRHDIIHPVTGKACKKPSTGWRWDQTKTEWALRQTPCRIHFGPDETTIPNRKSYLFEIDSEPFSSVFYRDGRSATLEVEELVGQGRFQFPKNTDVLAEIVELVTDDNDTVLDFFAGSASTGHAVMTVNRGQESQRRYILVQLPEATDCSEYPTICDIAEERLRGAARKIRDKNPSFVGDLGFRVFKLDRSNVRAWDPRGDNLERDLLQYEDHLVPGRTEQDVLYELLLKLGLDLCAPTTARTLQGKTVHAVGGGALFVCLAGGLDLDAVEAVAAGIVAWRGEFDTAGDTCVVCKDSGFVDDVAKTNMAAILRQHGITDVRSL